MPSLMSSVLHIAEIPYENGTIRFGYARILSADGTRWIKHGLFSAHHPNGTLSSEGMYLGSRRALTLSSSAASLQRWMGLGHDHGTGRCTHRPGMRRNGHALMRCTA